VPWSVVRMKGMQKVEPLSEHQIRALRRYVCTIETMYVCMCVGGWGGGEYAHAMEVCLGYNY